MAIFASIKKVTEKENYSVVKLQIMSKNKKRGNKREPSFIGNVSFVWKAHICKPQEGQFIKIDTIVPSNCKVNDNGQIEFFDKTMLTVLEYELQEDSNGASSSEPFKLEPINESDLPF